MKNSIKPGLFLSALLISLVAFTQPLAQKQSNAVRRLAEGNARYAAGKSQAKNYLKDRNATATGQQPYAIVLACADSRLSPEIIFDESLGQLFVVRVAGNVVDPVVLGSIEYAAEHLHAGTLLILGHESCGAVQAALAGEEATPNIEALVKEIAPAAEAAKRARLNEAETLNLAIKENVLVQAERAVKRSEVLAELVHQGKLEIVCGIYNLHTGRVDFFPPRAAK